MPFQDMILSISSLFIYIMYIKRRAYKPTFKCHIPMKGEIHITSSKYCPGNFFFLISWDLGRKQAESIFIHRSFKSNTCCLQAINTNL